ncbi:hypothetical protein TNCV_3037201 [Trichonephila clavipes]|nr:hypothetical protein TNCV_3037201 [Trichonephila clavipes]
MYDVQAEELNPNPEDKFAVVECFVNNPSEYMRALTPTRFRKMTNDYWVYINRTSFLLEDLALPTNPSAPAASELPAKSFLKQCVISGRQGQPRNDHQDSNLAKSGDNVINLPMGVHQA